MSTVLDPEVQEAYTAGFHNQPAPLVPIFVYGTLRVGHGNYEWCKGAVKRSAIGATSVGTIWFAYDHGSYPVAKFDQGNTKIVGDVLWFNPNHRSFDEVVSMEYGAGYVLVEIEYEHEGQTLECLAFHYVGEPRGPRIESGDWAAAAGR